MFGPRRGYDAIGEPSVSNADKPRVQPVKVDPKVWMHPVAERRIHFTETTRVHLTMPWVVSFPILGTASTRGCSVSTCSAQVFFANERTFLAWVHMALMLGGMAVGIIGFSTKSGLSPLPGLVLLPVAICFVVRALGRSTTRARARSAGGSRGPTRTRTGPWRWRLFLVGGVLEHPHPFGGVVALRARVASTASGAVRHRRNVASAPGRVTFNSFKARRAIAARRRRDPATHLVVAYVALDGGALLL